MKFDGKTVDKITNKEKRKMKEKILLAIPVRLDSSRLPNKALKDFHGKPMISRVVERALESGINDILLATDNAEIFNRIKKDFGKKIEVLMVAEPEIKSGTDRIAKAMDIFDKDMFYDIVVNLQGDQPLMKAEYIKNCADIVENYYDVGTLVCKVEDKQKKKSKNIVKTVLVERNKTFPEIIYFSRSEIPYGTDWFYYHLGIYSYKREILAWDVWKNLENKRKEFEESENIEGLRFIENNMNIGAKIVDEVVISVDVENDYKKAKELFFKQYVLGKQS